MLQLRIYIPFLRKKFWFNNRSDINKHYIDEWVSLLD